VRFTDQPMFRAQPSLLIGVLAVVLPSFACSGTPSGEDTRGQEALPDEQTGGAAAECAGTSICLKDPPKVAQVAGRTGSSGSSALTAPVTTAGGSAGAATAASGSAGMASVATMQPATAGGASGAADVGPQLPAQPGEAGLGDEDFADYGNSGYDVGHYDIKIRYTPGEDKIEGVTTITLTPNIHLSRFNLDFVLAVSDVTVDGSKAMFAKEGHHELVITPAASLPAGRPVDVVVKYADVPGKVRVTNVQLGGWWPTRDGVIAAGAPESAWWWFPNNDHPSDKATHAVTVTVPDNLVAISNGVQVMPPMAAETGFKTWSWVSMKPQQSNVTLLAIGDFEVTESKTASGLPVTLAYSKRSNSANARASLDKTVEIVAWEESVFGPYPFEAVGGVLSPSDGINYAMEMQTRPTYPLSYFAAGGGGDSVIAHENAHQWFGNATAVKHWRDVWLSEGFATYAEWLYSEQQGNGTAQELFDAAYARAGASDPFWQVVVGDPGRQKVFDQAVYNRGAMTLQQVRVAVGDAKFFEILKMWSDTHRYGNATIEDFIALCEMASGKQLQDLFKAWLFTAGKPQLTGAQAARAQSASALPVPRSWSAIAATQRMHRPLR
jgi:aminopeptidase N